MKLLQNVLVFTLPLALGITVYLFCIGRTDVYMSNYNAVSLIQHLVPDITVVNEHVEIGRKALQDFWALGWTNVVQVLLPRVIIDAIYEGFAPTACFLFEFISNWFVGFFGTITSLAYNTKVPTDLPSTPFDDIDISGWASIISNATRIY